MNRNPEIEPVNVQNDAAGTSGASRVREMEISQGERMVGGSRDRHRGEDLESFLKGKRGSRIVQCGG